MKQTHLYKLHKMPPISTAINSPKKSLTSDSDSLFYEKT